MPKKEKIIMYDSPEAAELKFGIKGWVSREGFFHGDDEHYARWSGCTHLKCKECGSPHRKSWTLCEKCRGKKQEEREIEAYTKMEVIEWNEKVPVCICGSDVYFNSWGEINDYCEEIDCTIESLRLVICVGIPLLYIDINDHFYDVMHEDQSIDDIDQDILDAADELNELIKKAKPMTYHEGDKAVKI